MTGSEQAKPGTSGGNPYLRLLRIPGAWGFVAAGFVGRMPMSMLGIGIVLLVSAMTGRYGTAGAVAATGAVCYAILVPRLGGLTDRFGQARVLRPLTAVFGLSATAFIACAVLRAPLWTLFMTGGALGGTMPSLGSMVRARWSYLVGGTSGTGSARSTGGAGSTGDAGEAGGTGDASEAGVTGEAGGTGGTGDTQLLHTAFSLESVADELIFITGPAIVTILATETFPVAGVTTAAVLAVAGTLWFAAQRQTEPPPQPREQRTGSAIRLPGMPALAVVYVFLGAMFGTIDLSTIAFAAQQGHKPLAGLVLGTYALGSAVGGLWYGARQWRSPLERRFLITLAGIVLGVAPMWALPSLPVLFVIIFFSGLSIAPTLIAGFSLIERTVPQQLMTEGMSWLSTSIGIGLAIGPPVAGHIVDARGAHWGYAFALGCGVLAAVSGLLGARALRLPPGQAGSTRRSAAADSDRGSGRETAGAADRQGDSDRVPPWQRPGLAELGRQPAGPPMRHRHPAKCGGGRGSRSGCWEKTPEGTDDRNRSFLQAVTSARSRRRWRALKWCSPTGVSRCQA